MNEVIKCKVRDIKSRKDRSGRWEIRLEQRHLPDIARVLRGNTIKLKFHRVEFAAHTGIAALGKPSQYFWINTHKDEAGPLKSILQNQGYQPNDEIMLSIDSLSRIATVMIAKSSSRNKSHQNKEIAS